MLIVFLHSILGLIVIPELPIIGTSPDSLAITKDGEIRPIEIKCPSSCTGPVIEIDYLTKDEQGNDIISDTYRGPQMMLQVQIQIFMTKAECGYFFVWTPQHTVKVLVNLDIGLI